MTITIAGTPVNPALLPDLRAYLKKGATMWSAVLSIQGAFTIAELNALAIGNTVTLGDDTLTWTGVVYRLESRPGYSITEIFAIGGENNGLNTYDATTDPAISDDSTLGYAHGSLWFNVASHTLFMCEDATTGSALWRDFYPADSGGDVVGPAGATADSIAVYNSTTGKLIKDGGATIAQIPLLAGRAGGQTLIGGTAASDNLTLTSTSNVTLGKVTTASQLESTLAIGTAPITVTSTTVCPNLNASLLEGHAASYFAVAGSGGSGDVVGPSGATADSIAVYNSTTGKLIKDGGSTIAQIPLLAGRSGGQTLIGGTAASDNLTLTSTSNGTLGKITTASQFESTITTGTAPITVTSTTVCPNLNASSLNGNADTAFVKHALSTAENDFLVGGTGGTANTFVKKTLAESKTILGINNLRRATVLIGDGVSVITTGIKGGFECPITGNITAARIESLDAISGAIAIAVWIEPYAGGVPTAADEVDIFSIAASGTQSQETGLTISITAGDWITLNVDSVTSMKLIALSLTMEPV